jgi:hypothetical protein
MTVSIMNKKPAAGARPTAPTGRTAGRRRDEVSERDKAAFDPEGFGRLEPSQQAVLVDWIRAVLVPAKTAFRRTSYGMKHDFARDRDGFYVYSGTFEGAMLAAGYQPVDANELYWRFRVRPSHPLGRCEQHELGLHGRGWLVRDRWREVGYAVLQPTQGQRILTHSRECEREGRPQILVLRSKYTAKITLDLAPAGCRFTPEAAKAVLALFAEFDPKSRNCLIINEQMAVIRSVPGYRAKEVSAALVSIAKGCSMQMSSGQAARVDEPA